MRVWWWLVDYWVDHTGSHPPHLILYAGRRVRVTWEIKAADGWVGHYWHLDQPARQMDLWLIPHRRLRGLPLHLRVRYGYLGPAR